VRVRRFGPAAALVLLASTLAAPASLAEDLCVAGNPEPWCPTSTAKELSRATQAALLASMPDDELQYRVTDWSDSEYSPVVYARVLQPVDSTGMPNGEPAVYSRPTRRPTRQPPLLPHRSLMNERRGTTACTSRFRSSGFAPATTHTATSGTSGSTLTGGETQGKPQGRTKSRSRGEVAWLGSRIPSGATDVTRIRSLVVQPANLTANGQMAPPGLELDGHSASAQTTSHMPITGRSTVTSTRRSGRTGAVNVVGKYYHTWGDVSYDVSLSATPGITISPVDRLWGLACGVDLVV
jgi:hypothetical protein